MILRFYAKGDALCPVPGQAVSHGAPLHYVGRVAVVSGNGDPTAYPATEQPYEVDSETDAGRRLKLICWRDRDLFPADKQTAECCQVPLVDIAFADGVWSEKPTKKAKAE